MRLYREFENGAGAQDGTRRRSLPDIKAVVALASGKGGTGKSSVAVNLAVALARRGRKVGILDADLNSPAVATMLGMGRTKAFAAMGVIEPAAGPLGLRVLGVDLLHEEQPVPVGLIEDEAALETRADPAPVSESRMLARMLREARFGALDLLLIDLASGLEYLERIAELVVLSGVLLVSQSSELALCRLRRAVELAARNSTPVLGVVENMAGFYCGHCQSVRPMLPQGDSSWLGAELSSAIRARLPFDPCLAESCDRGVPFIRQYPDSPLGKKFVALAEGLEEVLFPRPASARPSPSA